LKKWIVAAVVVWLAAGAAGGCGGSSSSTGGGAQTSGDFGQQYCALFEPCCAAAGLSTTGQVCQAFVSTATAKGSYDAAAGSACLDALRQQQSSPDFCAKLGGNPAACKHVFAASGGSGQPGATCMTDGDCAPAAGGGALCFSSYPDGGTAQVRTCLQTLPGTAGSSPCVGTVNGAVTFFNINPTAPTQGYLCDQADGLYCDAKTTACTALAAVGQSCAGPEQCVASAYCDYSSLKCAARAAVGAACTTNRNPPCDVSAYCDGMTCVKKVASGSPCTAAEQCDSGSCVNAKCGNGLNNLGLFILCGP
jgi:hypothetical protein